MSVLVRPARPADAALIHGFVRQLADYERLLHAGRAGLYVEDLFVVPQARGRGAGKALLAALARRCIDEDLGRLEWAVLDWNAPAIAFYDRVGAASLDDWTVRRVSGEALAALAGD